MGRGLKGRALSPQKLGEPTERGRWVLSYALQRIYVLIIMHWFLFTGCICTKEEVTSDRGCSCQHVALWLAVLRATSLVELKGVLKKVARFPLPTLSV